MDDAEAARRAAPGNASHHRSVHVLSSQSAGTLEFLSHKKMILLRDYLLQMGYRRGNRPRDRGRQLQGVSRNSAVVIELAHSVGHLARGGLLFGRRLHVVVKHRFLLPRALRGVQLWHAMDVRTYIVSIIADTLKIDAAQIGDDSKLIDLAVDSIALFELLIRFEKALGQTVRYEDVAGIETVGDIIKYAKQLPQDEVLKALEHHLAAPA
jgi:acyl carrier protein